MCVSQQSLRYVICNFKVCGQKRSNISFNAKLFSLLDKANPMFSNTNKIQTLGTNFQVSTFDNSVLLL